MAEAVNERSRTRPDYAVIVVLSIFIVAALISTSACSHSRDIIMKGER